MSWGSPVVIADGVQVSGSSNTYGATPSVDVGFISATTAVWVYASSVEEEGLNYPLSFTAEGSWDNEHWFAIPVSYSFQGGPGAVGLPWNASAQPAEVNVPVRYLRASASLSYGGTIALYAYYAIKEDV
jgi:hypothetical protein